MVELPIFGDVSEGKIRNQCRKQLDPQNEKIFGTPLVCMTKDVQKLDGWHGMGWMGGFEVKRTSSSIRSKIRRMAPAGKHDKEIIVF